MPELLWGAWPCVRQGVVADLKADKKAFSAFLKAERNAYLKAIKLKAAGFKPLNRASGRFATVFAAGSLAIRYKVFSWDRDALLAAVLACQLDGLRMPKGQPLDEQVSVQAAREKLVRWLRDHQDRFMDLDQGWPKKESHEFGSVLGYKATFKDEKWLYLTGERFDEIVGKGSLAKEVKSSLAKDALLAMQDKRFVVQRPIFKRTKKGNKHCRRVHALKANIISGADD